MLTMTKSFSKAHALLQKPIEFDALLATLAVKDRARVEKQVADYETGGAHELAALWKRLMCSLSTLAPHRTKINAPKSIQFYEQDGKNRRQVFAMEDSGEQIVTVYCEDIFDQAVKGGLLNKKPAHEGVYALANGAGELAIERIDGSVVNPPEFFKHMVGWNRKAMCIKLPASASKGQIAAAELLCAISLAGAE